MPCNRLTVMKTRIIIFVPIYSKYNEKILSKVTLVRSNFSRFHWPLLSDTRAVKQNVKLGRKKNIKKFVKTI